MTLQITAPHFCAGLWLMRGYVTRAAPIIKYMLGWTDAQVYSYCDKKKWTVSNRTEVLRAKRRKNGTCLRCGQPTVTKTLCLRHAIYARNQAKDKKGWYKPYRCKSRLAEEKI